MTSDEFYIYQMCKSIAKASNCEKRRFGCVAVDNIGGDIKVLKMGANRRLPMHKSMCADGCIRVKINSGTDSMLGSCGHAEEAVMWSLAKRGITGYDLYVLQLDFDGIPVPKKERSFYCARCATAMYYAEVNRVWVLTGTFNTRLAWEWLTTEEAIESSYEFALGNKKA